MNMPSDSTNDIRSLIEALKAGWLQDPCWDIEHTEGFEAYEKELAEFHKKQQLKWDKERKVLDDAFKEKAEKMGLSGLLTLINQLEDRVKKLESEKV